MAAALLDSGLTAHSMLKIPIPCDYGSTCNVSVSSELGRNLQEVDLILLDGAVMSHKHFFLLRLREGRLEQNDVNDVQLPSYVNTSERSVNCVPPCSEILSNTGTIPIS